MTGATGTCSVSHVVFVDFCTDGPAFCLLRPNGDPEAAQSSSAAEPARQAASAPATASAAEANGPSRGRGVCQ